MSGGPEIHTYKVIINIVIISVLELRHLMVKNVISSHERFMKKYQHLFEYMGQGTVANLKAACVYKVFTEVEQNTCMSTYWFKSRKPYIHSKKSLTIYSIYTKDQDIGRAEGFAFFLPSLFALPKWMLSKSR